MKRAFYYFKTSAGLLSYMNENFLHVPSTDLSTEVVKFFIGLVLAQATEAFLGKTTDEEGGRADAQDPQAAVVYTSLNDEGKEFMGKGIFDSRNWATLVRASPLPSHSHNLLTGYTQINQNLLLPIPIPPQPSRQLSIQARRRPRPIHTLLHLLIYLLHIQPLPKPSPDSGSSMLEKAKAHFVI